MNVIKANGDGIIIFGAFFFFLFKCSEIVTDLKNSSIQIILSFLLIISVSSFKGISIPSNTKTIFPKFSMAKKNCNC